MAKEQRFNKIYIAGPMTGEIMYNFSSFFDAERDLFAEGWGTNIVNPARIIIEMYGNKAKYPPNEVEKIIDEEKKQLDSCSAIYLLRGWEHSKGAKRELETALRKGLDIYVE